MLGRRTGGDNIKKSGSRAGSQGRAQPLRAAQRRGYDLGLTGGTTLGSPKKMAKKCLLFG
jgi:hypothetical protein